MADVGRLAKELAATKITTERVEVDDDSAPPSTKVDLLKSDGFAPHQRTGTGQEGGTRCLGGGCGADEQGIASRAPPHAPSSSRIPRPRHTSVLLQQRQSGQ